MSAVVDQEALAARARELTTLNGIKLARVSSVSVAETELEVHFYNAVELADILALVGAGVDAWNIFEIEGGVRLPAGDAEGEVRVETIAAGSSGTSLNLTIRPTGDYSTYLLRLDHANIDPVFAQSPFKFRPGCFTNGCSRDEVSGPALVGPVIDYLAKDYESFKHLLSTAIAERVEGWTPTSEADFTQVLIEVIAAVADELSDYQDRVSQEAFIARARKRVSLARHARLMDYHIHEGNQATTWLALTVIGSGTHTLDAGFEAATAASGSESRTAFVTLEDHSVSSVANELRLYSWSASRPALSAGETTADVAVASLADAEALRDLIERGDLTHMIVEQQRDPETGNTLGADRSNRELLELVVDAEFPEVGEDPLIGDPSASRHYVSIKWSQGLAHAYCFVLAEGVEDGAAFLGNVVPVHQGEIVELTFRDEADMRSGDQMLVRTSRWGSTARLPADMPLLYRPTETNPPGQTPTHSSVSLRVFRSDGTEETGWDEQPNLIHSDGQATHFIVETDETRQSLVRTGNGLNGRDVPEGGHVVVRFQTGYGPDGNVGADTLTEFDGSPIVSACRNPLDVTDGLAFEPSERIIRYVQEAYRARQLRAITLGDYVDRAEEVEGVSRAAAFYKWTGSWRAVRVVIDAEGGDSMFAEVAARVREYLEPVRLIGEDLEIRSPTSVGVEIEMTVCVDSDTWPEDVREDLTRAFGTGANTEGELAFFHSDLWTFGQALHASQLVGAALSVPGVEHVISVRMRRWSEQGPFLTEVLEVADDEIIRVDNDPDAMENGTITFQIKSAHR